MADQPETPLGLGEFSNPSYTPDVFPLAADDIVLLYTDGVIEARDQEGTFYPLAERITSSAAGYPETLVQWIRDDLLAYSGGSLGDDAAMIALQRAPHRRPPPHPPDSSGPHRGLSTAPPDTARSRLAQPLRRAPTGRRFHAGEGHLNVPRKHRRLGLVKGSDLLKR